MPKNLSAWPDLLLHLAVLLLMVAVISQYNRYLAAAGILLWLVLALFSRERSKDRRKKFEEYCESVVGSGREMMHYAMTNIPQSVMVINELGKMQWCNELTKKFSTTFPEQGENVNEFWDGILHEEVLKTPENENDEKKGGLYVAKIIQQKVEDDGELTDEEKYFQVRYRRMTIKNADYPQMIVLFIQEITDFEKLKSEYAQSRTVLMYIQVDNYDEIMQGLNEAEKTSLMLSVNEELEKWISPLKGFLQKVSNDLFVAVIERYALNKAVNEKFFVLDKVRQIISKNGIPCTLSIGIAIAEDESVEQSMAELGKHAEERLSAALSRGGDQVAMMIDGKPQYFGGRARAVEKYTRVRARVTANSLREHMENADEIFIMGHNREDFDSFGAAIGVGVMARHLKKNYHIVLSDSNDGIEKIIEQFRKSKTGTYDEVFTKVGELNIPTSLNPLLIVVDTHIPYLVAAPNLLERIKNVIVIDHHRKNEVAIKNPIIFYHEPSSSSASELVTELLMYFAEKINIGKLAATALYSGIVVDTKSFVVQTGARTFDAASYLRRNGADPVIVRELFMSDFETTVSLAKAKAQSEYFEGGLIISTMPTIFPNIQAMAGKAADSLLTIEGVRMTIVLFQMKNDTVGVSARSSGNLNVQVVMEKFGGGGHQNVAGAQVKNTNIIALKNQIIKVAQNYIAESDKEIANAK